MKLFAFIFLCFMSAGCTTLDAVTGILPTSGKKVDVMAVSYANPFTQDLTTLTYYDSDGKPFYATSSGGPGIVKSATAGTTAGTTWGALLDNDNDTNTTVNNQPTNTSNAQGGAGGKGGQGGQGGTGGKSVAGAGAVARAAAIVTPNNPGNNGPSGCGR